MHINCHLHELERFLQTLKNSTEYLDRDTQGQNFALQFSFSPF